MRRLLHAAGVQVAARRGHSDQTGGKGQQQSMADPVQRQRQELTGLRRVLATPGDSEMHECEDGRQRVRSQQREVSVLLLASSQSETGSKASSVGTSRQTAPRPNPHKNGHNTSRVLSGQTQSQSQSRVVGRNKLSFVLAASG